MRAKKEINIRVGKNIQATREQARYTQEELSEILDITPNHLSAIERGASGATLELIEKLNQLFGTSADYLLFNRPDGVAEDKFVSYIVTQLSQVNPEYRPQIKKVLSALLEILTIQERNRT